MCVCFIIIIHYYYYIAISNQLWIKKIAHFIYLSVQLTVIETVCQARVSQPESVYMHLVLPRLNNIYLG